MLGVQAICFGRLAPAATVRFIVGQSTRSDDAAGLSRRTTGWGDWLGGAAKSAAEKAILAKAVTIVLVFMERGLEGLGPNVVSVSY